MKKIPFLSIVILIFLIQLPAPGVSWELYDRVIAVVNTIPITESDISEKIEQLKQMKKIRKKKLNYEKSRIVDMFIENVLVNETAEEQSIYVTNKKLAGYLEKLTLKYFLPKTKNKKELIALNKKIVLRLQDKLNGVISKKDPKMEKLLQDFINYTEKTQKIDFYTFVEEIRTQLKKEQIMQIAIGTSPPSKKEAKDWYRKNKKKLGFEISAKHILIIPRNRSLAAERKANKKIEGILKRIKRGESFEKLAAKYSHDRSSAVKGGDLGWVNLATLDPYFAGYVYNMKRRNQISRVFKSGFGYHIVKYRGRRGVKFENVERMIIMKLYNDKMAEQFGKWVEERKSKSAIKIFMKNYKKRT